MSPLRGHAEYLEFVGRSGGGWGTWVVAIITAGLFVAELLTLVH